MIYHKSSLLFAVILCMHIQPIFSSSIYLIHEFNGEIENINAQGVRVGRYGPSPALWIGTALTNIGGAGIAHGININNQVAGIQNNRAFLFTPGDTQPILLDTLGGTSNAAFAINNDGIVVGSSTTVSGITQAYFYDGFVNGIGSLDSATEKQSWAYGINNQNPPQITGASETLQNFRHAFIYQNAQWYDIGEIWNRENGLTQDHQSEAFAINDDGMAVGQAEYSPGLYHAFLYDPASNPALTDLGTLGGAQSEARSINNFGRIVGTAAIDEQSSHAFIYQNGNIEDLNQMIPDNSGWELLSATAINDKDQIVGSAVKNGITTHYQLTPKTWHPVLEPRITPTDVAAHDNFGYSVAISDRVMISGAPYADNSTGAVYVFRKIGAGWEKEKLVASDGERGDAFGLSVGISGNIVVVGAPYDKDNGRSSGSIYIFEHDGTKWVEHKITPNDGPPGAFFGVSVAISENTVVAGASFDSLGNSNLQAFGSAYIFQHNGSEWLEQKKITASDGAPNRIFGSSVAVSGTTVVVGSNSSSSAYIYQYDGAQWKEQIIPIGNAQKTTVAISGDTVIIGTPQLFSGNAAHIYQYTGANWVGQKIMPPKISQRFGESVAISGDTAIVGDVNVVYVYRRDGVQWIEQEIVPASDKLTGIFGFSVAVSGDSAAIGDPYHDEAFDDFGAIYPMQILRQSSPFQQMDLEVKISAPPHSQVFSNLTYHLQIQNSGQHEAVDVLVSHTPPPATHRSVLEWDPRCTFSGEKIRCLIEKILPGELLSLPVTIRPTQLAIYSLSVELSSFQDNNSNNNQYTMEVETIIGTPELRIARPGNGEFIAQTGAVILLDFDLTGLFISPTGNHISWCLDSLTCQNHYNRSSISLGRLDNGLHRVKLIYVDAENNIIPVPGSPDGLVAETTFLVDEPRVNFLAPASILSVSNVPNTAKSRIFVAFFIEGWPLDNGRYFSWQLDGKTQEEKVTALSPLELPSDLSSGSHTVAIKLYDETENIRNQAEISFTLE